MESLNSNNLVVDIYFNNAYQHCKSANRTQMLFYSIRSVFLIIFIPIEYLVIANENSKLLKIFFNIALAHNILYFLLHMFFYISYTSN